MADLRTQLVNTLSKTDQGRAVIRAAKRASGRRTDWHPTLDADGGGNLRTYWRGRLSNHNADTYAGIGMEKFPEDLRVYEHLLWMMHANVVIELGAHNGGSTLWFRDRLEANQQYGRISDPMVIAVDIVPDVTEQTVRSADPQARNIRFVTGDVTDPTLPSQVEAMLRPGDRPLVIEDSAHTYETTYAALKGFARFVPDGGFLVVEDTCVDKRHLRIDRRWPRGVVPALDAWLRTGDGRKFEVDRGLEIYGITCHPGGFLRRVG